MQIAFWSPGQGQAGTTMTTVTMGIMTAVTTGFKVLLCHSQAGKSAMERSMIRETGSPSDDRLNFRDNGLEALKRLARNGRLQPEMIQDYTTPLLSKGRLDLLQGTMGSDGQMGLLEEERQRRIYQHAGRIYDLVFVDVQGDIGQSLTEGILSDSDLIVVCLNQNTWLLEDFCSDPQIKHFLAGLQVVYHLGTYDADSRYTAKNLSRRYGLGKVLLTPYTTDLRDAANNGTVLEFLLRHHSKGRTSKHKQLIGHLAGNVEQLTKEGSVGEVEPSWST